MTYEQGDARLAAAKEARARYEAGESVRHIATTTRRSYGYTHRLLAEVGTRFRTRSSKRRTTT